MHFKKILFFALLSNLSSNLFSAEGGSETGGSGLDHLVSAAAAASAAAVPVAQEANAEAAPEVVVLARDPRFPYSDFSIRYFPEYGERKHHENYLHRYSTNFRSLLLRWETSWDQAVSSGDAERQKNVIQDYFNALQQENADGMTPHQKLKAKKPSKNKRKALKYFSDMKEYLERALVSIDDQGPFTGFLHLNSPHPKFHVMKMANRKVVQIAGQKRK